MATINGTDGNDYLIGTLGADSINGGIGDDTLIGAGGADRLFGRTGADILHGGAETILRGGGGNDVLSLSSAPQHSVDGGAGTDRFVVLRWHLDLTAIANDKIRDIE